MKPGPFGHEHPADRAQAILWDYDSYGRLPRHVKALDVGAFTEDQQLISVAPAREFFVLTQWTEGASYHLDLERLAKGGRLRKAGSRADDSPGTLPGGDPCQKTARSRSLSASASGVDRPRRMYYGADRQLPGSLRVYLGGSLARDRGSLQSVALAFARGGPTVCRRSMEIFIHGMSCSGKGLIFQCSTGHEGSGGNRQTM